MSQGKHDIRGLALARYATEKCDSFVNAETADEALAALWHLSQLVAFLPDDSVEETIRLAARNGDFRIRLEACYLAGRWGRDKALHLLTALETDRNGEVREALKKLREGDRLTGKNDGASGTQEALWTDILRLVKERDAHRVGQFIAGVGGGSVVLLVLSIAFVFLRLFLGAAADLVLCLAYVLGTLGIEGTLLALLLREKQKVVAAHEG